MVTILPDEVDRFLRAVGPQPDETLREMDAIAEREGFPHVGPEVGGVLRVLARLVDAERIFEFGSGYGYSAYWFAAALPADGEIVLTEVDEAELELAAEFLAAGGYDGLARYELGDAMETIEGVDGPFDAVLLDHEKERYPEAFTAVEPMVPAGGVVVADNMIQSTNLEFDRLLAIVEGEADARESAGGVTRGVAEYLEAVGSHPDFETVVLPVGEGIAVSYRRD